MLLLSVITTPEKVQIFQIAFLFAKRRTNYKAWRHKLGRDKKLLKELNNLVGYAHFKR